MKRKFLFIFFILILSLLPNGINAYYAWLWENPGNIRVYIPQGDDKTQMMSSAFMEWQTKTNGFFRFQPVKNPEQSQIEVIFIEKDLTQYCGKPTAMGCATKGVKNGDMHSKIYIAKRRPKGLLLSNTQVYAVMRHEIGHALGLAHCSNPRNIMFDGTNLGIAIRQDIQQEDIQALFNLYHSGN